MPVESAADRAMFVNGNDFGEPLIWAVPQALPVTMMVIGQAGTIMVTGLDGPSLQGQEASVTLPADSLPAGAGQGDDVVFRGKPHLVKSIEPDGTGMVLVRLEEDI